MKGQAIGSEIDLNYLDEAGFAPTMPVGYTWAREGVRAIVPYEAPEGRRVNVIGSYAPYAPFVGQGDARRLVYASRTRTLKGEDLLEFIWRDVGGMTTPVGVVPAGYKRAKPCVIVMDNYSVHRSQQVKEQLPALEEAGISLFYLPPYSPELNPIEGVWRHVKHEDMPIRSYTSAEALMAAVNAALDKRAAELGKLLQHVQPHPLHLSTTNLSQAA